LETALPQLKAHSGTLKQCLTSRTPRFDYYKFVCTVN
jgi:hypothetical protein